MEYTLVVLLTPGADDQIKLHALHNPLRFACNCLSQAVAGVACLSCLQWEILIRRDATSYTHWIDTLKPLLINLRARELFVTRYTPNRDICLHADAHRKTVRPLTLVGH